MRRSAILLIFLSCFLIVNVSGQNSKIELKLDTNAMLIGDHVGLSMRYTGPASSKVLWPMIPDTILGNINVIERGKIDTSFSSDKKNVTLAQHLRITCYDSGFYTIPPVSFEFRLTPDTTRHILESELLYLTVHTIKVDTTKAIKPIIGPIKVPITFREILPWIIGGVLLVAVILGIIWYIRKRRKNQPVIQFRPKVVLPPHEMALQRLEVLRSKKLWQSGQVKLYYVELTDIVRIYIEERFHVPAMEQTTGEILDGLAHKPECGNSSKQRLKVLLENADMVKFAKARPVATENEASMNDAVEFVHETTGIGHTEIKDLNQPN
jgi:hypothetical protein